MGKRMTMRRRKRWSGGDTAATGKMMLSEQSIQRMEFDVFPFETEDAFHEVELSGDLPADLKSLIEHVKRLGSEDGLNVVAYSGGVDSSLVAYLVHEAFPSGRAAACIGISPSMSKYQLTAARDVANVMNFNLIEVVTNEGEIEQYVQNEGKVGIA